MNKEIPIVIAGKQHDFVLLEKAAIKTVLKTNVDGIYDDYWDDEITPGEKIQVIVMKPIKEIYD